MSGSVSGFFGTPFGLVHVIDKKLHGNKKAIKWLEKSIKNL